MRHKNRPILLFLLALLLGQSCAFKKDILYFQDLSKNSIDSINTSVNTIQVNDILSIRVSDLNQEVAAPFNLQNNAQANTQNNPSLNGYLVNPEGKISFPILGNIQCTGSSIADLENRLTKCLLDSGYLKNPTVMIRVLNNKVTVLGEVRSPGTYVFSEQNITLLQVLGYAGDLTINGSRKDILIIREENGKRSYQEVDMTSVNWFKSASYQIRTNDVVVVKPNNPKIKTAGHITGIGGITGILSFALSIFLLINTLSK
jgi:polysaccharide export outer membrane protein